jgi:hypothetical protein
MCPASSANGLHFANAASPALEDKNAKLQVAHLVTMVTSEFLPIEGFTFEAEHAGNFAIEGRRIQPVRIEVGRAVSTTEEPGASFLNIENPLGDDQIAICFGRDCLKDIDPGPVVDEKLAKDSHIKSTYFLWNVVNIAIIDVIL